MSTDINNQDVVLAIRDLLRDEVNLTLEEAFGVVAASYNTDKIVIEFIYLIQGV